MTIQFNMRATEVDSSGYYYPRWDRAVKISVTAENRSDAIKIALDALGNVRDRLYDSWAIQIDSIEAAKSCSD